MSQETLDWLNENTLIGFTNARGHSWHYREGADNHYNGAIPLDDVLRRLFDWTADERELYVFDKEGKRVKVEGRKAIVRSDTYDVLGVFRDGYAPHQYPEWLVKNVANLLDGDLGIGSAGLLKGGAVAWVSVEVPESVKTQDGIEFRPNLMAATSFDGSLATTYKRVVTNVVCDNTMTFALREHGQQIKVKHSRNSDLKLGSAREALNIVFQAAQDFEEEVSRLLAESVSDQRFERIVDRLAPLPGAEVIAKTSRAETMAQNKRDSLWTLWENDARVLPWKGTAYGAWQAFSTYGQHMSVVRNANRVERNMLNALNGKTSEDDLKTVRAILATV